MDKDVFLDSVRQAAAERIVTKDELLGAFGQNPTVTPGPAPAQDTALNHHLTSSEVFYYIGGAIVFTGIAVLVGGSWQALTLATKLLVTLGVGILCYGMGAYFIKEEHWGQLSTALFLISALVLPIGLFTVYEAAGFEVSSSLTTLSITAVLTILFSLSYWFYKRVIFTLFTIIFATGLFFSGIATIIGGNPLLEDTYLYQPLVVGLAYLLIGYQFSTDRINASLTGWLYTFGSIAFFGAALSLGGFFPNQNIFWELVFPLLVAGQIAFGIRVKSRSLLVWGAIFLMGYILKITAEYFSQGLGWPLALVIAGLSLIGLGYYLFYLNRRYLTK